jgi:RNA polymerase sigma factor (sigma-70 family)
VEAARTDPGSARDALAYLCETYWYPLYSFARGSGVGAEDARDLVQGFFAEFLSRRHLLKRVSPARGRFRSYILAALKHHMENEWDRARALKRGGGQADLPIEIDAEDGERRRRSEPAAENVDPELLYARCWARTLLDQAKERVRERYRALGSLELYEAIAPFLLPDSGDVPYSEVTRQLGMTEGALKVAVHRLRGRFGNALRELVADLVDDPQEVDSEIRYLITVLGS